MPFARDELDIHFGVLPPPGKAFPSEDSPQLNMLRQNMELAQVPPSPWKPIDPEEDKLDQMKEAISTNLVGS